MSFHVPIANLIPGMQSLALVGRATPGYFRSQKGKKGKRPSMIKDFTEIMIGVPLIGATANLTSAL